MALSPFVKVTFQQGAAACAEYQLQFQTAGREEEEEKKIKHQGRPTMLFTPRGGSCVKWLPVLELRNKKNPEPTREQGAEI